MTYPKPWTLPLIVAAIVVPVVAGFVLAGPVAGLAAGLVVGVAVIAIAARAKPVEPIETAPSAEDTRHLLIVVTHELDDPAAVERIGRETGIDRGRGAAEVLVLAPAETGFLDRWATDVAGARTEAQRKLVISVASLGKAQIPARTAVGDEDVVQAVEDQLRTFPADEVFLVTGSRDGDPAEERAARTLAARLRQPLTRIALGPS